MADPTPTDKILAVHYKNINKPFLKWLNRWVGWLKKINGGNADMLVKWRDGCPIGSKVEVMGSPDEEIEEYSPVL